MTLTVGLPGKRGVDAGPDATRKRKVAFHDDCKHFLAFAETWEFWSVPASPEVAKLVLFTPGLYLSKAVCISRANHGCGIPEDASTEIRTWGWTHIL